VRPEWLSNCDVVPASRVADRGSALIWRVIVVFELDHKAVGELAGVPAVDAEDRLSILPGLTGMWQISGRSHTSFEQ
jgi:hypothetical protein